MGPRDIGRQLALPLSMTTPSYEDLVDAAARAYWLNRPDVGPRCGSIFGYYDHKTRRQPRCAACRKARAMIVAIQRRRVQRGLNPDGSLRLDHRQEAA